MLDIDRVRQDIESWIVGFVEVPHPALGGWPPCPYARQARINNEYRIQIGINPILDLMQLALSGLGDKKVVMLVYDADHWNYEDFHQALEYANTEFLLAKDLIVLEDHPQDPEIVNGVPMNQGTYAIALVQSVSDLDQKARLMARQGFYDSWPENYLKVLFNHRKDPRQ